MIKCQIGLAEIWENFLFLRICDTNVMVSFDEKIQTGPGHTLEERTRITRIKPQQAR